jgi:hypothetical protein
MSEIRTVAMLVFWHSKLEKYEGVVKLLENITGREERHTEMTPYTWFSLQNTKSYK